MVKITTGCCSALSSLKAFTFVSAARIRFGAGGRTRLPKFKFSANFPIGLKLGLRVILQLQIKKKSKMPKILCKKIF